MERSRADVEKADSVDKINKSRANVKKPDEVDRAVESKVNIKEKDKLSIATRNPGILSKNLSSGDNK